MKNRKVRFAMTDEELKILRESIDYAKNLDIFKEDKKRQNSKTKKIKKVASFQKEAKV